MVKIATFNFTVLQLRDIKIWDTPASFTLTKYKIKANNGKNLRIEFLSALVRPQDLAWAHVHNNQKCNSRFSNCFRSLYPLSHYCQTLKVSRDSLCLKIQELTISRRLFLSHSGVRCFRLMEKKLVTSGEGTPPGTFNTSYLYILVSHSL